MSSPGTRPRQAASDRGRSQQKRAAYPPSSGLLFLRSSPSGPLPRRFVARARPPRRVGEAPTRDRGRACPDQRVGAHTQIFEEYGPEATRDIVERVLYEIDAVVMGVRFLGRRAARTAAPSSCVGPAVDDGVAASSCRLEDAHRSQAVGHLLGEPALDCGCLGELGGVWRPPAFVDTWRLRDQAAFCSSFL